MNQKVESIEHDETTINYEYRAGETQPLRVKLVKFSLLPREVGCVELNMASIISAPNNQFCCTLKGAKSNSGVQLVIFSEEITSNRDIIEMQFAAKNLDKKDHFLLGGKSDPFMIISRTSPMVNGKITSTAVHLTEVKKNTLDPTWDAFRISIRELCNGNPERLIKFEIFDWDDGTNENDLIGTFTTTYSKLIRGLVQNTEFPVIHPGKGGRKKTYVNSGSVYLKNIQVLSGAN